MVNRLLETGIWTEIWHLALRQVWLNILLWIPAYGSAAITIIVVNSIARDVRFDATSLASLVGDMLGFLGVLTAILIGVFVNIHSRARDATETGFASLREAVEGLDRLGDDMASNLNRGLPEHQEYLRAWANSTKELVVRLNEILPTWAGWRSNRKLEDQLLKFATVPTEVVKKTGTFLVNDEFWKRAVTDYDHRLRRVLIGLYSMNEGALGNQLVHDLFEVFSLLVTVLLFGLGLRVISGVGHGPPSPDLLNLYWGLSLVAASALLLTMMLRAVDRWWTGLSKQERHWSQ